MKTQKSILGKTTGSLINYVMGNNKTLPEVGKGATILSWSDRHAYEVMSISEDGKRVIIQKYLSERIDTNGMSESQEYKYEKLNGFDEVIVWRNNAWRKEIIEIVFTKEYGEYVKNNLNDFWKTEDYKLLYPNNEIQLQHVIKGKTKLIKKYPKVNIIWGIKDEYYDYSF